MNTVDNLAKYGHSFQSKVISALIVDAKILNKLSDIVDPKFFESDANKWIVDEIISYHDKYKKPPTLDVFKSKVADLDNPILKKTVVDQLRNVYTQIGTVDIEYISDEFTSFCINQNLKQVILKSVDLLKLGEYDKIKDNVDSALKVGTNIDLGQDYVEDFDKRYDEENRTTIPTGWKVIDDLMNGGLGGGELGVIVAPSGVGKTWLLTCIGANAVKLGKNVVHYSMELSEDYVGQRYDTVFTHVPTSDHKEKRHEIKAKIDKLPGKLIIKYFPPRGVSRKQIQRHIEQMTAAGTKPDVIILDYADLLLSSSPNDNSTYQEQGGVYIELRGMSGELQIPIWTASQTNRSAIDSEVIEADKIADSYAKVMNADFIVSWSRKAKDKLNNTARAHIMKNRFGPDGLTFPSKMDTNTGFIEVYDGASADGILSAKESNEGAVVQKKLLHKKYLDTLG